MGLSTRKPVFINTTLFIPALGGSTGGCPPSHFPPSPKIALSMLEIRVKKEKKEIKKEKFMGGRGAGLG